MNRSFDLPLGKRRARAKTHEVATAGEVTALRGPFGVATRWLTCMCAYQPRLPDGQGFAHAAAHPGA